MAVTGAMVLTTRNHTMQRGAYEAMALDKPLITSSWPLLRQTFSRGTVYVDNSVDGITAGLETFACNHPKLAVEMKELRHQRHAEFVTKLNTLLALVKT